MQGHAQVRTRGNSRAERAAEAGHGATD
eukprot:COSAG06_NODE_17929_length_913_cov_199.228501_1_plen_27_part_10